MWHEIKSQEDIDVFMKDIVSFHDCCIREIRYISGMIADKEGAISMDGSHSMSIYFDTQASSDFIRFEMELGVVSKFSININPTDWLEIYDATFIKKEDGFYWHSDTYGEAQDADYMFHCQTVRWRTLPNPK